LTLLFTVSTLVASIRHVLDVQKTTSAAFRITYNSSQP
jgi:hypothetical protein